MNKRIETYMAAILSNPEFIRSVASRYGNVNGSVGMPELATTIAILKCIDRDPSKA